MCKQDSHLLPYEYLFLLCVVCEVRLSDDTSSCFNSRRAVHLSAFARCIEACDSGTASGKEKSESIITIHRTSVLAGDLRARSGTLMNTVRVEASGGRS